MNEKTSSGSSLLLKKLKDKLPLFRKTKQSAPLLKKLKDKLPFFGKTVQSAPVQSSDSQTLPFDILPVAPHTKLDSEDNPETGIYRQAWAAVLRHPDVRNIAVTGSYGVGKSSILHAVLNDKARFISICNFKNSDSAADAKDNGDAAEANDKHWEYNLLSKLFLESDNYFGLKRSRKKILPFLTAFFCFVIFACALFIFFSPYISPCEPERAGGLWDILHDLPNFIPYAYIALCISSVLLLGILCFGFLTGIKITKFQLKQEVLTADGSSPNLCVNSHPV